MSKPNRRSALLAAGGFLFSAANRAGAQESPDAYPSKPVKFVAPFAAAGAVDVTARRLGQHLAPVLGQAIVIDNRPGAGGNIGAQVVARSAPDGYTILLGAVGTNVVNQFLYPSLPFDPIGDFAPITLFLRVPYVVVVAADSPIRSFADLVETARRRPGKLNQALTAIGGPTHLAGELLKKLADVNFVSVPYNGTTAATVDLLAGRVDFMFDNLGSQLGNIDSGKIRVLATTAEARSADLPGVPTIAESGFPSYSVVGWSGLFAPARTPAPVLDKLFNAVRKTIAGPEFHGTNRRPGDGFVASASRQEFAAFLSNERAIWGKLIREAGIRLN